MVKNLPLLISMLIIGSGTITITLNSSLPQFLEISLLLAGTVLNVWSMVALILHIGIANRS